MKKFKRNETLIVTIVIIIGVVGLVLGLYSLFSVSRTTGTAILANGPVHWHPHLEIIIKDEKIGIPADIGIGVQYADSPFYDSMMSMTNMHTHDATGVLHWEVMMHAPTPQDMYLGNFFQVWGETFNKNCVFEFCNGPEGDVNMTVNGELNNDFEKYIVKDGDEIVIEF